jgi:hypothetical protein
MGFELGFGGGGGARREEGLPLRVVAIGDFGASGGDVRRAVVEPGGVDRVMAQWGVQLEVSWEGERALVRLDGLESMEPDRLVGALPWAAKLRLLRRDAANSVTSTGAVQNAMEWGVIPSEGSAPGGAASGEGRGDGDRAEGGAAGDLASLLGRGVGSGAKGQAGGVDIQKFIKSVVGAGGGEGSGGGGTGGVHPRSNEVVRGVDAILGRMVRAVLHDERFQRIESVWRAAAHFVSTALAEESVRFEIVHARGAMIDEAVRGGSGNGAADSLGRMLGVAGGELPAADVVILAETMELTEGGIPRVTWIGREVARRGGTVLVSLPPEFVGAAGLEGVADAGRWASTKGASWRAPWDALVGSGDGVADRLAGVMPRWLARRPYGVWSEPVETFVFEEIDASARETSAGHGLLCWAGGAWLLGRVIAEGWIESGEGMRPGLPCVVGDLPMATWKDQAGSHVLAPVECWLNEGAVGAIGGCGGVAIAPMRGRDAAVIGPIQSIRGGALLGRWDG